ncbi:ATP-binding protein [Longimicrobium terrae]|uniref:histidine kinase n=2 Tax=Longimicrobium terrae TaxID=1639882 RepID=A0A841GWR1_9BACT|nr:ATP-binding protein [Longimicrobium terrae]MBB4635312.1 PAS domain S-box-containing protein [Longimicrobium terrae]MBB6069705.1 PAS domain S-box-containing protein [Longimicrobium terrae]NNC31084.1 PAS domain S-box protein [Longimicrobium terrae]
MTPSAPPPHPAAPVPADDALERVARLCARLFPGSVSLLYDAGDPAAPVASAPAALSLRGMCLRAAESASPLIAPDAAADPTLDGMAEVLAAGIRACAAVPLLADGEPLGALAVGLPGPGAWAPDAVDAVHDLAGVAAAELAARRARACHDTAHASSTGLFRALVEQSLAAIYVIQDGVYRYVNPHVYQMLGFPPGWFDTPRSALDIIHEDDRPMVQENLRRRVDGEVPSMQYRVRGRRYDGSTVFLEVHGSRAEIDGRPAVIGIAIDVTRREMAEREREHALLARDRFYAMISHELRTPVSAVMLYNDLLSSGVYDPLSDEQRDAVERSQKSARHLLDLINDLLDLAKLDAGKLETRLADLDVAQEVEGVVAGLAPLAAEHGCPVSVQVDDPPLRATGDPRRVQQILLNLLSNAVKFGHGHPIEVNCRREGGGVVVQVADHGPGIGPDDLERIFDDFVQVGEPGVGTGLGLPIARRLAELQGGSLTVSSREGEGSTFRLILPIAVPPVAPSTGFSPAFSSVIIR